MTVSAIDLSATGMAAGYQQLLDKASEVLSASTLVQALFVVGSAGRGEADPHQISIY